MNRSHHHDEVEQKKQASMERDQSSRGEETHEFDSHGMIILTLSRFFNNLAEGLGLIGI